MEISIRKATVKDLRTIQDLNCELVKREHRLHDPSRSLIVRWPYTNEAKSYYLNAIKNRNDTIIVAEVNGEMVGYLIGGLSEPTKRKKWKKRADLENMMITKKYRGRGIGTRLVKEFFKWCKKKKVDNIKVDAAYKNILGLKFYRKLGFREYAIKLEKVLR